MAETTENKEIIGEVKKESDDTQLKSPLGYLQERVQKLEDAQEEIRETLAAYDKRINDCSVQR